MLRYTLAISLCLFCAAEARAQTPNLTAPARRQGYYVGLGTLGATSLNDDADLGSLDPLYGGGLSLRGGEMLTERFGLGLQLDSGWAVGDRWQARQVALMLEAQLVPWRDLVLRVGAGMGSVQLEDRQGVVDEFKGGAGAYYGAAIAYEFFPWSARTSGGLALAPVVQVKAVPGDAFQSLSVWAGVEILWWFGLQRQELELPPDEAFVR